MQLYCMLKIYQIFIFGWICNVNFTRWYKHLQNFLFGYKCNVNFTRWYKHLQKILLAIIADCQNCCHSSSCGPELLQLKICKKQIYVNTWMTLQCKCKNNLNLNWVSNIFSWFGKNLKSCGRILLQPLTNWIIVMSILLDDTKISRNPFGYNYNVNSTRWYKHLQNSFWIL